MFQASAVKDGVLELLLYGDVVDAFTVSLMESWGYSTDGMISALNVKKAIDDAGEFTKLRARINSPGGDVFEGFAIYTLLTTLGKPVEVVIDGVAASIASVIAMAGSERKMSAVAMMMIHNCWGVCVGNGKEMRKCADALDKIDESITAGYAQRTGKKTDELLALMAEETWLSAKDCVEAGFATEIIEQPEDESAKALAQARGFRALAKLKHVPEPLKGATDEGGQCECACDACQNGDCANCSNEECEDSDCVDCPMQQRQEEDTGARSDLSLYEARFVALRHGIR